MTEQPPSKKQSPFDRVLSEPKKESKRNTVFLQVSAVVLSFGAVFAANTWINIPQVEFGSGVASIPACTRDSVVNFDLQVFETGTVIRALDITGLSADCDGQYLRLSLTSSTESVLRQMTSNRLTTATTLRLVPASPALDPDVVRGINLEVSDTAF